MVVHACLSILGQEDLWSSWVTQRVPITKTSGLGDVCSSMVEHFPSMYKALGFIPSTEGKNCEETCLKDPSTPTQTRAKGPGMEIINTSRPGTQTASGALLLRATEALWGIYSQVCIPAVSWAWQGICP